MASEYRVRWRREDEDDLGPPRQARYRIYQKRKDAERWMAILQGRILEFDGLDPDEPWCCPGGDCDCRGVTRREAIEQRFADVPPLVELTLQVREVGDWHETEVPA